MNAREPNKQASRRGRAAAARRAAAEATQATEGSGLAAAGVAAFEPAGRPSDVFGGEFRRRDVFSMLVLHLIHGAEDHASYGNQLIERIEELTRGAIVLNPNTIYPLLRELEQRGLIEGHWEHPQKRSRRLYTITPQGRREYRNLRKGLEPFLDSIIDSISLIKQAVYGQARPPAATGSKPKKG